MSRGPSLADQLSPDRSHPPNERAMPISVANNLSQSFKEISTIVLTVGHIDSVNLGNKRQRLDVASAKGRPIHCAWDGILFGPTLRSYRGLLRPNLISGRGQT